MALRGTVMMRTSIALSRSWKLAMIGSRPANSGIRPNSNRSVGFTRAFSRSRMCWSSPPVAEMKPKACVLAWMLRRPTKAPPQMKRMLVVSMYWPCLSRTGEPSMIFSRACCTLSPEAPRAWPLIAFSLSTSSMKTMPHWARATSPSAFSSRRCRMASISSLTNSVCASEVASAVTKGTFSARARVSHSSVLPVPVEPTSRMLLFATSTASLFALLIFL